MTRGNLRAGPIDPKRRRAGLRFLEARPCSLARDGDGDQRPYLIRAGLGCFVPETVTTAFVGVIAGVASVFGTATETVAGVAVVGIGVASNAAALTVFGVGACLGGFGGGGGVGSRTSVVAGPTCVWRFG